MDIVICGAGKVGEVLSRDLSRENHGVVIIEKNEKRLNQVIELADVSGVVGSGSLLDIQRQAGVDLCDIFIAVTPDDETNIIAAITARKIG
ncbi:MAG: NAD-binding protein, partial [Eubacteriales bacterium]|nr:NAD-binding protein [Eubacteriales bacterium]